MRKVEVGDLVLCPDEDPSNWEEWKFFMFEVPSESPRPRMWMSFSREELLLVAESMGKEPVECDFEVYISETCSKRRIVPLSSCGYHDPF